VCNKPSIDGRTHPGCRTRYSLDGTFSAIAYKRIARRLLYQLKYQPYLTDLLPTLGELCCESLIQNELFVQLLKTTPLLVPIPLSAKRLRKRGYNQAALLAKELGKRFGMEVLPLLKRIKETKPQYGLKREERITNMKDAFMLNDKGLMIEDKLIVILIDDVLTTGSTMSEAAKVLKKNGVREVWGVALAKD
jgi:competence protein ComFC